jgi:RNA polymerase sigma factor (sigma-70 family)
VESSHLVGEGNFMDPVKDLRSHEPSFPPPRDEDAMLVALLTSESSREREAGVVTVYKKYGKPLYIHALDITEDEEDASDAMVDVLGSLPERMRGYEHRGKFFGWLATVVGNRARDLRRKRHRYLKRYLLIGDASAGGAYILDQYRSPEDQYDPTEACAADCGDEVTEVHAVRKLLKELCDEKPDLHEALVLRWVDELEYCEIASKLGVAEPTVRQRVLRARRWLSERLPSYMQIVE